MEEKTRLQVIMEQKAEQVRNAIEQAIDEGAIIERLSCDEVKINGLTLFSNPNGTNSTVLFFMETEKIAKVFKPSKDELEKMAEQKRAELEEIEKQIKSK